MAGITEKLLRSIEKPFIVFLDAGHGGFVNGKYVTAGKRSPVFDDGTVLFEGVHNRLIVRKIQERLSAFSPNEILVVNVSAGDLDTPLKNRVETANRVYIETGKPASVYVSVHSDAAGDGVNWHPASGFSVYTSKGETKSDVMASLLLDCLKQKFGDSVKWRYDNTDGDQDKEADFYVLRKTMMPAILSENGFHTNKEEAAKMFTDEFNDAVAQSHVNAILAFRKVLLYGS